MCVCIHTLTQTHAFQSSIIGAKHTELYHLPFTFVFAGLAQIVRISIVKASLHFMVPSLIHNYS